MSPSQGQVQEQARRAPQPPPSSAAASATQPRTGVINVALRTKAELYLAWMPFVRGGGIFVPTARPHELGDEVFLLLSLMQDPAKIHLRGKVVWINPEHAAGGRPQGIGVGLEGDPAAEDLGKLVEGLLAAALKSARPTHTL